MRISYLACGAFAVTLCAVTLPPVVASAEQPKLSTKQRREAKRLFDQGMLAYRRGDYEESILRWQESYDVSQHPLTFEAIANAHEKLGDYEAALDYLQRWRAKAPRREHEVLDARIANYQRQIAKQKKAQSERDAERERLEAEAKLRYEQQQGDEAGSSASPKMIAGWTLVGTGAAAIISGVVLDVVANGSRPNQDEVCRSSGDLLLCSDSDRDDIEQSNTLAIAGDALWIGGLLVAAGGATLLVLDALDEDETASEPAISVTLTPLITPTTVGFGVLGSF